MAGTGLDEHHLLLHELAVGALEFHGQGGCSVGGAAAAVGADTTELGTVGLHTRATRQLKLDWLGDLGCTDALFAFLFKVQNEGENINTLFLGFNLTFHCNFFSI